MKKFSEKEKKLIKDFINGKIIIYDDNIPIFENLEMKIKGTSKFKDEYLYYAQKLVFIHENNKQTKNTKYYQNHINSTKK